MTEEQGNDLLVSTAMGAQAAMEDLQIVIFRRATQDGVATGTHDEIAHAIGRKLHETGCGLAIEGFRDAGQGTDPLKDLFKRGKSGSLEGQVDLGKGAEGAVMDDIGIGDGQDDAEAGAEAVEEF